MPTEPSPVPPIRGPLKYSIETSSPQLEAGRTFSVSVRITNPYDVPVTVSDVITKLPAKFTSPSLGPRPTLWQRFKEFTDQAEAEGQSGTRAETPGGRFIAARSQGPEDEAEVVLQPGNSTVQVFGLLALGPTFFTPSSYNLNIEIVYSIDQKANRDTVAFQMSVRAPLRAIIWGSVVGSVMGFLVHDGGHGNAIHELFERSAAVTSSESVGAADLLPTLITTVLSGAIVVVAFARKKEAQPILSIEDFWGGLFVGFLTAYGGNALLKQLAGAG